MIIGCPHKKSLFPVQRVAVIVTRQAAAIYFTNLFLFGRKILTIFLGKKEEKIFAKMKKKVSSRTFFSHPAAPPETDFFSSLA